MDLDQDLTTDIEEDTKVDASNVKNSLGKLCLISNQIVKTQLKLDKLNLTLKQLNILQAIRLNQNNSETFFTMEKNFTHAMFSVTVKNLNAHLDGSFLILTSIQLKKPHIFPFIWLNKCEHFNAIKPNLKHVVDFKLSKLLKNNYFPFYLTIHLIFDTKNNVDFTETENKITNLNEQYMFEMDKRYDNSLSEFSVCIYRTEFNLSDFFKVIESEFANNDRILPVNEFSLKFNILTKLNRQLNLVQNMGNLWSTVKYELANDKIHVFGEHFNGQCYFFFLFLLKYI